MRHTLLNGMPVEAKRCLYCSHGTFHDKCIRCEIRQQNIEQKMLRLRDQAAKSGVIRLKEEVPA